LLAEGVTEVNPTEFSGRVALVTGAAGMGIGQAVARRLAAGGAHVVVTDIHPRRTAQVAAAIASEFPDTTVRPYVLDAGDAVEIGRVCADVERILGPIRILVNNAAINHFGSTLELTPEQWDAVIRVDLSGPWHLARATLPQMRDAGGGVVVNLSSISTDVGGLGLETAYAVAKGGLNAFTRAYAHEGAKWGIRAVTVSTGFVAETKFALDHADLADLSPSPLGSWPKPSDIAEAVAFVASDRAAYVTGETLNIAAGSYMRV
jgi:NAD(P)-dependent dehydrogenase (short-subunit alcohol dehydrogenase family)